MTAPTLNNAFDAQLYFMYNQLESGVSALAAAGVERRKQLFDFLNGDLVPGASVAELKAFLNTDPAFRRSDPPHRVSGVVASDGTSLLPLLEGVGSVRGIVDPGIQSLSNFIAGRATSGSGATAGGGLGGEHTSMKLVWDPIIERWVWKYDYTLLEAGSNRLDANEVSRRFIEMLNNSTNPPALGELRLLEKIKPTYRLVCAVSRDESASD